MMGRGSGQAMDVNETALLLELGGVILALGVLGRLAGRLGLW
ncbi:MAG TPA: hypothetical protein VFA46_10680 [Actinomycetes bacterium]|nr:hypothetical protein [Actinomycetes bacterium]